MFGWIKIDGYSYMGQIFNINMDDKICNVSIGDMLFTDVPFSEIQVPKGLSLPWE